MPVIAGSNVASSEYFQTNVAAATVLISRKGARAKVLKLTDVLGYLVPNHVLAYTI